MYDDRVPNPARLRRRRWLLFLLSMVVGFALGLYYGWFVNPVRYVNATPVQLRADYQTDYVLMVAEGYARNHDLNWARHYLALLGDDPVAVVETAIRRAVVDFGYGPDDVALMRALLQDLRRAAP